MREDLSRHMGWPSISLSCLLAAALLTGCGLFRVPAASTRTPGQELKQQIHLKKPDLLKAGVARVEITPPVGTPLAGYSKRRGRPSVGIRDPLYVRVLSVSDAEDTIVLIATDLLVFPHPLAETLLTRLSKEFKIPRQSLLLTSTHTHSGFGSIAHGFLFEKVFGRYRPEVAEGLTSRITSAVRHCLENLQPVRWGRASAKGALLGLIENRAQLTGFVDPSVGILLFESPEGRPVGILVHAAAHPTLMDSQDLRMSADYPGELTKILETTYPGSVCLFVNGAAGDVRPKDALGLSPEERIGRFGAALAEVATALINQASMKAYGDLASWGWKIALPPPQLSLGPLPIHPSIGKRMRPSFAFLNLCALEDTVLVPLPAELTAELGLGLKTKLKARNLTPVVMGYANGYLGYAVTPLQYQAKTYEARMSWYGPNFGPSLVEQIGLLSSFYDLERPSDQNP